MFLNTAKVILVLNEQEYTSRWVYRNMKDHSIRIKKTAINIKLKPEVTNKQTTFMKKHLSKGPIEANAYVHIVQFGLYYYINYISYVPAFSVY